MLDVIRLGEQHRLSTQVAEDRIAWVIGCGRTGSTWLSEMLAEVPRIRRWHEPYFGRLLKHIHDRPQERDRASAFFADRHKHVWVEGLRNLFFQMVRHRYPQFGRHSLVIKEVNTPELYGWIYRLFPASKMILLVRDPFDVLDSYLDLQKPGSWNDRFGDPEETLSAGNVERTAQHIRSSFELSLAAFDAFPSQQKLQISFEGLLENPVPRLQACGELIGVKVSSEHAADAEARHRFDTHAETGKLKFRRHGKAGVWKGSANFSAETKEIAERVLGDLRQRLGYPPALVVGD